MTAKETTTNSEINSEKKHTEIQENLTCPQVFSLRNISVPIYYHMVHFCHSFCCEFLLKEKTS